MIVPVERLQSVKPGRFQRLCQIMADQVNMSSLNSVKKGQKMSRSTCPDVTTVFHDWTSPIQAAKSLGGSFGNARNVLIPTKVRSDVQIKKTDAIELL